MANPHSMSDGKTMMVPIAYVTNEIGHSPFPESARR